MVSSYLGPNTPQHPKGGPLSLCCDFGESRQTLLPDEGVGPGVAIENFPNPSQYARGETRMQCKTPCRADLPGQKGCEGFHDSTTDNLTD